MYSIAFGTHTKTAEPIEMPFGVMSGSDAVTYNDGVDTRKRFDCAQRTVRYVGVTISEGEGAIWRKTLCPISLVIATSATRDRFRLNLLIYRRVGRK